MDTNTTTSQTEVINETAAKVIVKPRKQQPPKVAKVITTSLVTKAGINKTPSFDLENFPKSLGNLLNDVKESFTITLFGGKVSAPSITAKTDNKDRVLSFLKSLVNVMFANMEVQQVLPADKKDQVLVLTSLKKAGFKFTQFNKIEVSTAVELWAKHKQSEKKVSTQRVIAENTGLIARTKINTDLYKTLKAANLADITGLEVKERKALGMPAKVEDKK